MWTESNGMVGLGDLSGGVFRSDAWAVSGDGETIVGWSSSSASDLNFEACKWTTTDGIMALGDLTGGAHYSVARGVSAGGTVIVGRATSANTTEAFIWTEQTGMIGLAGLSPGGVGSEAYAVSGDGSTVVGVGWNGGEAFRWREQGELEGLGSLNPGDMSAALAVNNDGTVIVGRSNNSDGTVEPFRWTEQLGMIGLGMPPTTTYAQANAISADGSIIVGHGLGPVENVAFIWDAVNGVRLLQDVLVSDYGLTLDGWRITEARGISADGTVLTGFGYNLDGNYEAWRAVIPEPSTAFLLGAACYLASRSGSRHRIRGANRARAGRSRKVGAPCPNLFL